jgi:hypothetical protein
MKYNKFSEDSFTNEYFQMKVIMVINGDYVSGLFTKFPDEEIQVAILHYFDDRYYELDNEQKKYISGYYGVD